MTNKVYERATQLPFPAPASVVSGQPVLVGTIPAVCSTSYGAQDTPSGQVAVDMEGGFALTVTAKSSLSPSVNSAINPGDKLYADGGVLDATTNFTTGFTLDKDSTKTLYGKALQALGAGLTSVINVKIGSGA